MTLDTWGPVDNLFTTMYDALQANWGDEPSRTDEYKTIHDYDPSNQEPWGVKTGWYKLSREQQAYVDSCFARKTLQQVLEKITFAFLIDGCTRACTHQLVRTRIGAGMMQHGGRDNDWRHRPWVMPETIRRACERQNGGTDNKERQRLKHCIATWKPIMEFLHTDEACGMSQRTVPNLYQAIEAYLQTGRNLYAALVDAGIPWEDARRLLWMGTGTYIHIDYNYLALRDVLANRLEHIMDWEINCVAQLMLREVKMKCPPVFSKYLGSHSDIAGKAKFAGLQSWPPDGKYPNPSEVCATCGLTEANHVTKSERLHKYVPGDSLPREHRPEQNPFWVLHPDSMNGGPVVWIPTNGTYPHEAVNGTTK